MKFLPYLLLLIGVSLIHGCEPADCPGFKTDPPLEIHDNNMYDKIFTQGPKGEIEAKEYICDPSAMFLPINFHQNSFTFYLQNAWKTDTITLGYKLDAKYYGEDCGHRFMLQDMKVLHSTVQVQAITLERCNEYILYFKLQL